MAVSFATDVANLFRDKDRDAMLKARKFDLRKYDDVVGWADAILIQVKDGTMPCDQAWPAERVAVFENWIKDGKLP